jgi:hydrogenase maturation protease
VTRPLVIGLGSSHGDDAAGLLVARRLRRARAPFEVIEHRGDLLELLEIWKGRPTMLVDAAMTGSAEGTIHRVDAASPLTCELRVVSGHAIGLARVVELARALGKLPPSLVIYAIEGRRFEPWSLPGREVRRAVRAVASMIVG